MPKLKSNRGARKRFRETANGKFMRNNANKSHILTKKTTKRKRNLRHAQVVSDADHRQVRRLIFG